MLVYGPDGVGKSTFGASAPKPIFLGAEEGTNQLDVTRVKIASFADLKGALVELATAKHGYSTVVVDTADWVETLVYQHVIKELGKPGWTSIEDFGFGKGRVHALEAWKELLPQLSACRDAGLGIIILAHSMLKKFEDPTTTQGYDRYQLKLQDGAKTDVAGLLREFVDTVMFANFEVNVVEDDKRRGWGNGDRVLFTERRPAFDAKNRMGLPYQLEMSWAAYEKAAANSSEKPEDISGFVAQITDAALRKTVEATVAKAGNNVAEIARIKAKVLAVISQGKETKS